MLAWEKKTALDTLAGKLRKQYPQLRKGQSYMNALAEVDPEVYDMIAGTSFDPFYKDEIFPSFVEKVDSIWQDDE
jgi:hypothetical protein